MKNLHWSFPKPKLTYSHLVLSRAIQFTIIEDGLKCITVCSQIQTLQWQHEVKVNEGEKQTLIKFRPGGKNLGMLSAMTVDQEV